MLPDGFARGPLQGREIIGEITENLHRFILEGWDLDRARPRVEEDLSFVPKDRQEVIYVYMYRVSQNTALQNSKRWREARVSSNASHATPDAMIFERPPIYLDVYYLVSVLLLFRSEAERLLGWVMLRLWEAQNLIYRPRRYMLPDGSILDSTGRPWAADSLSDGVIMEKVSVQMIDDLPVSDAINFFTIHDAPYRPYLTFQAQCAMEGSLISGRSTTIRPGSIADNSPTRPSGTRPSGRMASAPPRASGRTPIGPRGSTPRPVADSSDDNSNSNNENNEE